MGCPKHPFFKFNIMEATLLITIHFIFDWVLQPRSVAKGKKENISDIGFHFFLNVMPMTMICTLVLDISRDWSVAYSIIFFAINCSSHLLIDLFLPSGYNDRSIINWTAVDQILHLGIMFLSIEFILYL